MSYSKEFRKRPRRPSQRTCPACGEKQFLVSCGVDSHLFAASGIRRKSGECNGRVYIHDWTGGMECGQMPRPMDPAADGREAAKANGE